MKRNKHEMDMSEERPPRHLFSVGDHDFEVMLVREAKSKAGNDMFIVNFQELGTGLADEVYLVAVKGKRWMLKSFLKACGIEPEKDTTDNYVWSEDDVIGQIVTVTMIHEPNEFINRAGETIKNFQHRISEFKKYDNKKEKPKAETWDEEDGKN